MLERKPSWTIEHGSLWALAVGERLPPLRQARVAAEFVEIRGDRLDALAAAMGVPSTALIRQRMQSGRRCFGLEVAGQIAAYGWVTRGPEHVGELEREFRLRDAEAYIWDCATLPAWRGRRCYTALLSQLIRQLRREGVRCIWIGASRQNRDSIMGFVNAGFDLAVDLTYVRIYRMTAMWIYPPIAPRRPIIAAAYRILLGARERRLGRLILGYQR